MANPWDDLAGELLVTLKDSVKDFAEAQRPEMEAFLKEKSQEAARQTWLSVSAPTEEEKQEAKGNLRHLKAQVIVEAMDKAIITTAKGLSLLGKVFDVAANFLVQYGLKLLTKA